jgi:replicative DNA helicase
MEMRAEELMERLYANVSCVSLTHIRERNLTPDELAAVYRGQAELEACKLHFVDNTSMTLLALKSKVRKYVRSNNIKLVVVDYLQLMKMGTRCENRREEVSEMSRELKSLAMECNIHIMALSQLNRVSTFDGTKVDISQLKESGSLEQDADQVWLLSWPKEEAGVRFVTVDVAKNRNGPLGAIDLVWLPQYQRFEE